MNEELIKNFEDEGKLFAKYWLSSQMTPEIDSGNFERFIEPHFTILMQGWEDKNRNLYPESDEEILKFIAEAETALRRGWQTAMDEAQETRRILDILDNI